MSLTSKPTIMKTVFFYGTLQLPSVQQDLLGHTFDSLGVTTIKDFVILNDYFVEDGHYPRLVPMQNGIVYGNVYQMSDADIAILDEYETDAYTLTQMQTSCGMDVWVYMAVN